MPRQYILGIDLGSASLGWALIETNSGVPTGVAAAGVRVFSPGVEGNLDSGQEESRNAKRREARQHRRQLWRRAQRLRALFALLQSASLLPGPALTAKDDGPSRQAILDKLDGELWKKWSGRMTADPRVPAAEQVLPYYLRAVGLSEPLQPIELGRALYHLGQRRGFKSNRKAQPKKDEKPGEVAQGISELRQAMQAAGAATLGCYFSGVDPKTIKIRRRWTERSMFLDEFERLWTAQVNFQTGSLLNDELKRKVHHLLFFQRPLQDNEDLIGDCELERGEKRAPWATLEAQRFRLLQRVNDMEIEQADGLVRRLTVGEREQIINALETDGDKTFASLRKLIGVKGKEARLNFERGGEKNCRGNRIASRMRSIFGSRWEQFSTAERGAIVERWRKEQDAAELARIAQEQWGLDAYSAAVYSDPAHGPEPGYCGFSTKAIGRLLPLLESGIRLQAAIKRVYPEQFEGATPRGLLPPARAVARVRNPAIERSLSELRKVVNAVIRRYDKPAAIRIELARDLKKSRDERSRIWKQQRNREVSNQEAATKICAQIGRASREDIEKYKLAVECEWCCPYTGKTITPHSLFTAPEFQVEHILPLSRYPDNSFQNKTLCHVGANADKANCTPWEAFHGDEQRWTEILERVKRFRNPAKLRRFQMTAEDSSAERLLAEFTERQLNDTRYASKLAGAYLALLYGGRNQDGKRRIFASSGQVTATLRQVWGLNGLLGLKGEKNRDDHRHHSVDAVVIALTDDAVIHQMADTSQRNAPVDPEKPYRPFKGLTPPWPNFVDSVREPIGALHISHRPEHKLSGPLHEETLYGRPYVLGGKTYVNVRKGLQALSKGDIAAIADPAVRAAVELKLAELGGDIKKLNAIDPNALDQLPALPSRDGRRIPIRRVRLRRAMTPESVGSASRERYVQPGNNHHLEIYSIAEVPGKPERWDGIVVSLLDASKRRTAKEPVIARRHPEGDHYEFLFSLMNGDMVEMDDGEGRGLFVVRKISQYSNGTIVVGFVRERDARLTKEMTKNDMQIIVPETMRKRNCRPVYVDLLGEVHYGKLGSSIATVVKAP